jgi:glycolate oxidase FAD binding subunit
MNPDLFITPASAEEVAATLRHAARTGAAVVPWGAGLHQHLGHGPARYEIALDMTRLHRVVEYSPPDLVLTVEAGARLGDVQALLAQQSQWLPWNPPRGAEATIGGLLAAGASGPLRLGYGPPRDWTLGMRVALGDGRLVKSGAKVVKNVAGYDAHKLHLGALGTLGVIVEATFKVAPLPETMQTIVLRFREPPPLPALAVLHEPPLAPVSLVAQTGDGRLTEGNDDSGISGSIQNPKSKIQNGWVAVRFAGVRAAVARQLQVAAQRGVELGAIAEVLESSDDVAFWEELADVPAPRNDGSLGLRAGVAPGHMVQLAQLLETTAQRRGWQSFSSCYLGLGLAYSRWWPGPEPAADAIALALAELRAGLQPLGGYAVVEDCPSAMRPTLDIWGPAPGSARLMLALRERWNPSEVLNPGRYVCIKG